MNFPFGELTKQETQRTGIGDFFLSHVLLRLYACVVGGAQETMEIKPFGGAAEGTEEPPRRCWVSEACEDRGQPRVELTSINHTSSSVWNLVRYHSSAHSCCGQQVSLLRTGDGTGDGCAEAPGPMMIIQVVHRLGCPKGTTTEEILLNKEWLLWTSLALERQRLVVGSRYL